MGWTTADDLDLHVIPPSGPENEIYYTRKNAGGGTLDVDANADPGRLLTEPVENVFFSDPEPGQYQVYIKNYKDRTSGIRTEYLVRVTIDGHIHNFTGAIDGDNSQIKVCSFDYPPQED